MFSLTSEPDSKRSRLSESFHSMPNGFNVGGVDNFDGDVASDGYKYIEKFNRDMMDQFLEFQRRSQSSFIRFKSITDHYTFV